MGGIGEMRKSRSGGRYSEEKGGEDLEKHILGLRV